MTYVGVATTITPGERAKAFGRRVVVALPSPGLAVRAAVAWAFAVLPARSLLFRLQFEPRQVRVLFVAGAVVVLAGILEDAAAWAAACAAAALVGVRVSWHAEPRAGLVAALAIVGTVLAVVALVRGRAEHERSISPTLLAAAALAIAAARFTAQLDWHFLRNEGVLSLGTVVLAAVAWGAAPPPPVEGRARTSILLVPLTAAAIVMLATTGVVLPTVIVLVGLAGALGRMVVPDRWEVLERPARPVLQQIDHAIEAVDGGLRAAGHVVARGVHRIVTLTGPVRRLVKAVFRVFGIVVSSVLLSVVWLIAILLPWLLQRLLRWDPTWSPSDAGTRWIALGRSTSLRTYAQWHVDLAPVTRRRRRLLARVAVVGVVLALAATHVALDSESDGRIEGAPPAAGPWQEQVRSAMEIANRGTKVTQYLGTELSDLKSRYVNIKDGRRRTWMPPIDPCTKRLVVWVFGGSAAFGYEQRDEQTLPSAIARRAWRSHRAVEVVNWAVPGDVAWQQQRRLELALATEPRPPDLVVFYDGWNDVRAQQVAWAQGVGRRGSLVGFLDERVLPAASKLQQESGSGRIVVDLPPAGDTSADPDPSDVVASARFQLGLADREVRRVLSVRHVPLLHYNQPSANVRIPLVDGDFGGPAARRKLYLAFREDLPAHVVDVSRALDGIDEVFFPLDDVHTTEAANPIVASKIYRTLGAALRRLGPGRPGASCS